MQNKDIVIIALILVAIYLYYQQNNQTIQPIENNNQLQELKNQVQHYQSLYQKRVAKDLDAKTLNSEWEIRYNQLENLNNQTNREKNELTKYRVLIEKKVEDLENQLVNLAKQKIKGKKEAQRLLTDLETQWNQDKENWQHEKQSWEKKYQQVNEVLVSQRNLVNTQDEKIRNLEQKLDEKEEANQKQRKLIVDLSKKKPTPDSESTIRELKQEQQEQLRKINVLFDDNAANYETIDFNGLYALLQQIAERERERERAKVNDKEETKPIYSRQRKKKPWDKK